MNENMFKHLVTTIIGTVLMFASTGMYYASFFVKELDGISWKFMLWPFLGGLYLLFAQDNDILAPLKAIINKITNNQQNTNPPATGK